MAKRQGLGLGKSKSTSSNKTTSKSGSKAAAKAEQARITFQRVRVEDIVVLERRFRELSQEKVDQLADSMAQLGLLHPPTVYFGKPKADSEPAAMYLNSGQHRLAAAKKLGWKEISVIVVGRDKRKNAMGRISENLHRNSLSKSEEGAEIRKWLELRYTGDGQVAQHNDKGISAAAKQFGKSRRTIRRLVEAAAIHPDAALALKEAKLDNIGSVLEQVVHEDPDDQLSKVKEIVRERAHGTNHREKEREHREKKSSKQESMKRKSESGPVNDDGEDWDDNPVSAVVEALQVAWEDSIEFQKAWAAASRDDRRRFFEEILLDYEMASDVGELDDDVEEAA